VLGSTEILLRSRHPLRLPLSSQLGRHFSGNGSAIAFAYNAQDPVNGIGYGGHIPQRPSVGPVIGGMLDERGAGNGPMIQEGGIPGAVTPILRFLAPVMARATHMVGDASFDLSFRHIWREIDTMLRGAHHGALLRTQTFLAMGRDSADGVMRLRSNRLRISWPLSKDRTQAFGSATKRLLELTRAMKGRYIVNPFGSRIFGRRLITVHPLGGCRMGESAETGVVDANGRVFDGTSGRKVHEGLYVCDASVVPLALGTNPALTITALAERIASRAAEKIRAGYVADAEHAPRPLDSDDTAANDRPRRVNPTIPGIRYAERQRGYVTLDEGGRSRLTMTLHISAENVAMVIHEDRHVTHVVGVGRAPDFGEGKNRFAISDGTFSVLIDDERQIDTKLLVYRLRLSFEDGTVLWLLGHKTVNLATLRRGLWRALSRVSFDVYDDHWHKIGVAEVSASVTDAVRMMASMRVTYEPRRRHRARLLLRYWWFFFDAVIQARVWALARPVQTNPFHRDPQPLWHSDRTGMKAMRGDLIEDHPDRRFVITRYRPLVPDGKGGWHPDPSDLDRRPPVVLIPGFGMSTFAFRQGHPSIARYLHENRYQVWLLDYRASDILDASLDQFTLDDLACHDFPDAIRLLSEKTKQKVSVVAHCVGALCTFMAMLERRITSAHVCTVVLSQSFAFMHHPLINRIKARLRLPQLLKWLNFRPVLTADFDLRTGWRGRMLDRVLRFYPTRERCTNGVCRRLLFMYGEVIRHEQLDRRMHDKVYEMFDRANLTTFEHLARMIRRGRIVDARGKDVYLTAVKARNIDVPVTLFRGLRNTLFQPDGAERTYRWLIENGGFGDRNREMFRLIDLDDTGHLDTFIGKDARRSTFRLILGALRRRPHHEPLQMRRGEVLPAEL
jgi:cholesterol oxidase